MALPATRPDTSRYQLVRLAYSVFLPLARIFLRFGLARQLIDVWKQALVDAALQDGAMAGVPPTKNRVAMLTGLTKKETGRFIQSGIDHASMSTNVTSRILHDWTTNGHWLDSHGLPRDIPFDATDTDRTFVELCRGHSTSYTARTILDELVRAKCVTELTSGICRFVRLDMVPSNVIDRLAVGCRALVRLQETIHHNLKLDLDDDERRYQQVIINRFIPRSRLVPARRRVQDMLVAFNAQIGAELDKYALHGELDKDTVGVGFFYVETLVEEKVERRSK